MTQPPEWSERRVAVSDLKPYEKNPRHLSKEARERLKKSILETGYHQRVLAQPDLRIIGGHQRIDIFKELGIKEVVVLVPDRELTEDEFKRILIQDNLSFGEFDLKKLGGEFKIGDLKDWGMGDEFLLKIMPPRDDAKGEETPELQTTVVSTLGDRWELGPHAVYCGDSTVAENVSALLKGAAPNLMVSEPPYGVEYDASWRVSAGLNKDTAAHGKVLNDDRADWSETWALFPGNIAYIWHASLHTDLVKHSIEKHGFKVRALIIWAKSTLVMGRGDYHHQHEPCQPAGTLVAKVVREGRFRSDAVIEHVPIETLSIGDKVVSFGNAKVYRNGREITRIGSRSYTGNIHRVSIGALSTRATAEHQFTVRFNPDIPKAGLLYLMKRGDRYRIGVCGMFNSRGFGLAVRLAQELGEQAWIIGAFPDLSGARIAEQVASCVYGIPTTHWETDRNTGSGFFQRDKAGIEDIYRQIGADRIKSGVDRLAVDYGLSLAHPLVVSGQEGRFSRKQSRIVRACNLIPGIMQIPVPIDGEGFDWRPITKANFSHVDDLKVWSMDVDQDHHYVADGIVTHNCWYAVRNVGNWQGDRKQTTVWNIDKPQKSETGHSTQKPIECMQRPMLNNSSVGDAVYDPFLGSGTTLIAAEQIGRVCYGLELNPAYVDVVIRRWQNFTGKSATLSGDGRSFAEIEKSRI